MFSRRVVSLVCLILLLFFNALFAKTKQKTQGPRPLHFDRDGEKWAEKTLKKMSVEEKVGQMFMIWAKVSFLNVEGPDYIRLRDTMRKYNIGGFGVTVPVISGLLEKGDPYDAAVLTNQLQKDSKYPLLMAADFERGLTMRLNGPTPFPYPMAIGATNDPAYAEEEGRIVGEEARAIGIHWNWFPLADVNSNPLNPIINTRAFGGDPQQVGEFVAAYTRGAHKAGMMATAKHFPGHGDTVSDSHMGLASVNGNLPRLQSVELPPFQKAIDAGIDSVMVAHVTVPALDPDPNHVASNSHAIITDLLKQRMRFDGLVVTDALDMNGLMRLYANIPGVNPSGAAAVAAIKAGVDMILIPADLDGAYKGVVSAVKSGEISKAQIDASVLKILKAKASLGLNKSRVVDVDAISTELAKPANMIFGAKTADAAITVVRDNGQVLPLRRAFIGTKPAASPYTTMEPTSNRVVAVILTDDIRSDYGREFERDLKLRVPDAHVYYVDASIATGVTDEILSSVKQAEKVIVPVYLAPVPGKMVKTDSGMKNQVQFADATQVLIHRILETAGPRAVMIALGNPYVASDYPEVQNYLCTFSPAPVSEESAVRALFGEIPISGHLPVQIPGIAERGAGIMRAQVVKGGFITHAAGQGQ